MLSIFRVFLDQGCPDMLSEVKAFFTSPMAFAAVAALDAPRGTKTFPLVCNCGCLCGFGRSCEEDDDVVRATGGL